MTNTNALAIATAAALVGALGGVAVSQHEEPAPKPAQLQVVASEQVVAAAPAIESARLIACTNDSANIDPGTPQARVSTMRCTYQRDGEPAFDLWLDDGQAAKVRGAAQE